MAQQGVSVFWVHGGTSESFQANYQDLYEKLQLGDSNALDIDARQTAVKDFLESTRCRNWLMVIDNLDDENVVEPKFIPARRGAILITTRDRRLPRKFGIPATGNVEVTRMNLVEASSACERLGMGQNKRPQEMEAQKELLQLIDYLPLAISQTAAFMNETGMTTQHYLQHFRDNGDNQADLLDSGGEDTSRTVMRTWSVTIERIAERNPLAVELLEQMSLLDNESISLAVVSKAPRFDAISQFRLRKSVGELYRFALVTMLDLPLDAKDPLDVEVLPDPVYRVHPLVSFWTRRRLEVEKRLEPLEWGCASLMKCFPHQNDIEGSLSICLALMPHATTLLRHFRHFRMETDDYWQLQYLVASVLHKQGQYHQALPRFIDIMVYQESTFGKDHVDTLTTANNIAEVFERQGEYEKALEWYKRALEGREKVLGKQNPYTLWTAESLNRLLHRTEAHGADGEDGRGTSGDVMPASDAAGFVERDNDNDHGDDRHEVGGGGGGKMRVTVGKWKAKLFARISSGTRSMSNR